MAKDLIKTLEDLRPESAEQYIELTGTDVTDEDTGALKRALDVFVRSISTSFSRPAGLTREGKITEVTVSETTWTPLPATALADRNALGVQNRSGSSLRLNYDPLAPITVGIVIPNNIDRFYNITDSIVVYAVTLAGSPVVVTVEELA